MSAVITPPFVDPKDDESKFLIDGPVTPTWRNYLMLVLGVLGLVGMPIVCWATGFSALGVAVAVAMYCAVYALDFLLIEGTVEGYRNAVRSGFSPANILGTGAFTFVTQILAALVPVYLYAADAQFYLSLWLVGKILIIVVSALAIFYVVHLSLHRYIPPEYHILHHVFVKQTYCAAIFGHPLDLILEVTMFFPITQAAALLVFEDKWLCVIMSGLVAVLAVWAHDAVLCVPYCMHQLRCDSVYSIFFKVGGAPDPQNVVRKRVWELRDTVWEW